MGNSDSSIIISMLTCTQSRVCPSLATWLPLVVPVNFVLHFTVFFTGETETGHISAGEV